MQQKTTVLAEVERLAESYSTILYQHSLVMTGNPYDAQDAVQETFLRYIKKTPQLKSPAHEKAWLFTVISNICRDQFRRQKSHPQTHLDAVPEIVAPSAEETPLLDRLIDLPEKLKAVLLLHYVEGYKVKEIAQLLHLTTSTVKMRLQKGRSLLEKTMKEETLC